MLNAFQLAQLLFYTKITPFENRIDQRPQNGVKRVIPK